MRRSAFYLPAESGGQRFCVLTQPKGRARGSVVHVHPFAEEMNKSRRMVALGAEAFARDGWAVLQIDLQGCGDSSGDFGDASWQSWLDDVSLGVERLVAEVGGPVVLWGLRAGALVVSDWLKRRQEPHLVLLWQPVVGGRQHFNQFMRVRGVSKMLEDSDARSEIAAIRDDFRAGKAVEIAGYAVAARLAAELEVTNLDFVASRCAGMAIFEVGSSERLTLSPALASALEKWRSTGVEVVAAEVLPGPAFWQTQEIEVCPALIERSVVALGRFVS